MQHSAHSLKQWSERLSSAEALCDLVSDVATVQIGEDEHVGPAGNGESGALAAPIAGTQAASNCSSPSTAKSGANSG